jgi:hypothetical protein
MAPVPTVGPRQQRVRRVVAAIVAASTLRHSTAAPGSAFDPTMPRQLHLAPTEDVDGLLVSWVTGTPDWMAVAAPVPTHPAVRFGTAPGVYTAVARSNYSVSYNGTGDVVHRVELTGLSPDSRYYYVAGDEALDVWSAEWWFQTSGPLGAETPSSLLVIADVATDPRSSYVVLKQLGELAADAANRWDLLAIPGDLSYAGSSAAGNLSRQTQLWDEWSDALQPAAARVPLVLAPGNHDVNVSTGDTSGGECGVAMVHRFRMPRQNESATDDSCAASYGVDYWYSVRRGSVWLHSFSTAHSYFEGSAQRAWIEEDLSAAAAAKARGDAAWLVVQMHYPSYCSHPLGEWEGGGGGTSGDRRRCSCRVARPTVRVARPTSFSRLVAGDCNDKDPVRDPAAWMRANLEPLWRVSGIPQVTLLLVNYCPTGAFTGSRRLHLCRPQKHGVDFVIYGHLHAIEVTWPVFNGTVTAKNYRDPAAPVHLLLGTGGASFQGPWHPVQPDWSAFRLQEWGYSTLRFPNSTVASFAFTAFNGSGVLHSFDVVRSAAPYARVEGGVGSG